MICIERPANQITLSPLIHRHTMSSIGDEKMNNPRLAGKSCAEFIAIMSNLNLAPPKMIDVAVLANKRGGVRHEA